MLKTLSSRGVSLFAAPWVFREQGLKLGPFSSFVMDVLVDCAGAPLVEEAVKLWVVLRAGVLPKQVGTMGASWCSRIASEKSAVLQLKNVL